MRFLVPVFVDLLQMCLRIKSLYQFDFEAFLNVRLLFVAFSESQWLPGVCVTGESGMNSSIFEKIKKKSKSFDGTYLLWDQKK